MNPTPGSTASTSSTTASTSKTAATKNYKNRFTKILNYAKAHKEPTAVRAEIKKVDNHFFHYMVHYKKDSSEWETDLLVAVSRFTDVWTYQFHRDGELISTKHGAGYEELLNALRFFIEIPPAGTPDYNDLLIESVELAKEFKEYETLWD
jgi:hypothetical protein